jgi:hypothetical protein
MKSVKNQINGRKISEALCKCWAKSSSTAREGIYEKLEGDLILQASRIISNKIEWLK